MELINRKLIKWVFILLVIVTVIVRFEDIFSGSSDDSKSKNAELSDISNISGK